MPSSKQKRATWTEKSLSAAVRAVRNGLSTYKASQKYGIPRRTLRNHLKNGVIVKRLGRHTILTQDQEKDFVRRIVRFSELGIPMTPKMIRIQAFAFCQKFDIPHNFNNKTGLAGKGWLRLFFQRNPELAKRKAQFLNPARAQKLNKPIVAHHFEQIRKLYDELDLFNQPERIYNMDEKGCRLTLHHQQTVVSQKGAKRVHMQVAEHGENVTVVGCANALGNPIPPMILFKGKRKKPEFEDNLPPGSIVHMAPKGSMTTELFVIFIQHLAKFKTFGKCLLIFDGAKSHLDFRIAEEAERNDIVLYCLPSNTTHELQPMDKSCFKPFETFWDQEVLQYLYENRAKTISKRNFNEILTRVWRKSMTSTNILSGFRATGLYPLNPNAIPESAFAPSILTERSINSILPNDNEEFVQPPQEPIVQTYSDTATDTEYDSHSSSPIATLQQLRNLISAESLPTTPTTPDIRVLQDYSTTCTPTHRENYENQPGPSGLLNARPLVNYSDSDLDEPCNKSDDDESWISEIMKKMRMPARRLRIYSSSSSDTDSESESSKTVCLPQRSETCLLNENPKNTCLQLRQNSAIDSVNESSKKETLPQHSETDYQRMSTSPKNLSQDPDPSDEDNIPLGQLCSKSKSPFQKLMPTPDYGQIKTRPRRKALNHMGQRVTKDLFDKKVTEKKKKTVLKKNTRSVKNKTNKKTTNKGNKKALNNSKGKENESWYCHACHEDKVADMRPCKDCFRWYHEDCVGVTKDDTEAFLCPDCNEN